MNERCDSEVLHDHCPVDIRAAALEDLLPEPDSVVASGRGEEDEGGPVESSDEEHALGRHDAQLRAALQQAFVQNQRLQRVCDEQAEQLRAMEAELEQLRSRAAHSDLQQRIAERTIKSAHDYERRNRALFVARSHTHCSQMGAEAAHTRPHTTNRVQNAQEYRLKANRLTAENEVLVTYLAAALGVDAADKFVAYYARRKGGTGEAQRLARCEVLARTGGLHDLVEAAATTETTKQATTPTPTTETGKEASTSTATNTRKEQVIARQLVALLGGREPEEAADVAHNTATRRVGVAALCSALCVWVAEWPVPAERQQCELETAFRLPGQCLLSADERALLDFVSALRHEDAATYAALPAELCAVLASQAVRDAEDDSSPAAARTALALAHTHALLCREVRCDAGEVLALVVELLTRRTETAAARARAADVVLAAVAAWPEAFVPRPDDFLVHAVCLAVDTNTAAQSRPLLAHAIAACHWYVCTQDELARALVHRQTLAAFVESSSEEQGFRVDAASALFQRWFWALCVAVNAVPGFFERVQRQAAQQRGQGQMKQAETPEDKCLGAVFAAVHDKPK